MKTTTEYLVSQLTLLLANEKENLQAVLAKVAESPFHELRRVALLNVPASRIELYSEILKAAKEDDEFTTEVVVAELTTRALHGAIDTPSNALDAELLSQTAQLLRKITRGTL